MIGAIIGDIVGSRFEFDNTNSRDFKLFTDECRFTDDTVCTIATMDWLNKGGDYDKRLADWIHKYQKVGFSNRMLGWALNKNRKPYGSNGNGAAMRVSPVGWVATTEGQSDITAKDVASVTHNDSEGIKGAQAIADCITMARFGYSKSYILEFIERKFGYDLRMPLAVYRKNALITSAAKTVPVAIVSFIVGKDFEDVIRTAVSLGGDSDTIASMAGAIADAYFGIPKAIEEKALTYLPKDMIAVINQFEKNVDETWKRFIECYTGMPEIIEHRKAERE